MRTRTILVGVILLVALAAGAFADGMFTADERFWQAVRDGDTAYVKNAFDSGRVNPNAINSDGWSPLMVAVDNVDLQMTNLIMQYKPDMDITDPNGKNVYMLGQEKGDVAIQQALESMKSQ